MGKKKVSQRRAPRGPRKVEIHRGLVVVELTREAGRYVDKEGREYEAVESHGDVAYYLKHACQIDSKYFLGICSNNPLHRSHCSELPPAKDRKCSCGGKYTYTDIYKEAEKAREVKEAKKLAKMAGPTIRKRNKASQ